MKRSLNNLVLIIAGAVVICVIAAFASPSTPEPDRIIYEYKQFSTIESVVPGGMGRSRILTTDDNGQMREKELKNFYSMVGINFDNIANNDRVIVDRLNEYGVEGWELMQVSVASQEKTSNGSSSGGLFITRYLFRRVK